MKKRIITIGRQYGCGGVEIGKQLAEDLNIPFYDKEILKLVADKNGIRESYFYLADERVEKGLLERLVKNLSNSKKHAGRDLTDEHLFELQSEVIRGLAEEESCIIVGRLADYVLRDREDVLSVFIHASEETRVKHLVECHNLEEEEAKRLIKKRDKEREDYCTHYSGRVWADARNYTICVDSGVLGEAKSMEVIRDIFCAE